MSTSFSRPNVCGTLQKCFSFYSLYVHFVGQVVNKWYFTSKCVVKMVLSANLGQAMFPKEISSSNYDAICAQSQNTDKELFYFLTKCYSASTSNESTVYSLQVCH